MERFGARVKRLRLARVIYQRELAERAGIKLSTVQRIESGESRPYLATVRKLAQALEVDASELVRGTDFVEAEAAASAA